MEKIKLLLYCTKQPLYLVRNECDGYYYTMDKGTLNDYKNVETYNGKIVAECDFEVDEIDLDFINYEKNDEEYNKKIREINDILHKSCLKASEIGHYLNKDKGYAIHIKNLKERVMELSDVYKYDNSYDNMFGWIVEENKKYIPLDKAPQNMCRVWIYENGKWVMYILISVRPEWLCLELNGEKEIEIRKRVLKEML